VAFGRIVYGDQVRLRAVVWGKRYSFMTQGAMGGVQEGTA
jgi:hypothetical protein